MPWVWPLRDKKSLESGSHLDILTLTFLKLGRLALTTSLKIAASSQDGYNGHQAISQSSDRGTLVPSQSPSLLGVRFWGRPCLVAWNPSKGRGGLVQRTITQTSAKPNRVPLKQSGPCGAGMGTAPRQLLPAGLC